MNSKKQKAQIEKPKVGRPKLEFDLQRVEDFGYFRATYETMAALFDCSYDTIRRNMQESESMYVLGGDNG